MTDEQEPPTPPTERDESADRTERNVDKPRRVHRIDGRSGQSEGTPPKTKSSLFRPRNKAALGRAQPLTTRNPVKGFDDLLRRVVDRLLYRTIQYEKDGKRYAKRTANPVTANVVNAVTNAVRLQLDIYAQYEVSARLESQKAELEGLMKEMERIKQRGVA